MSIVNWIQDQIAKWNTIRCLQLEKLALPVAPFPETIPEESSSNDEEHVMIFRLGSIPESEGLKEGTIFKVSHVSWN